MPFGRQVPAETSRSAPVVPVWFKIMSQMKARRYPVGLISTSKATKDLSQHRSGDGYSVLIQKDVDEALFR